MSTYSIGRSNGFYTYIDSGGNALSVPAGILIMEVDSTNLIFNAGSFGTTLFLSYVDCTSPVATSNIDLFNQVLAMTG